MAPRDLSKLGPSSNTTPVLRRGADYEISTVDVAPPTEEIQQSINEEIKNSRNKEGTQPKRIKTNYEIRQDLVKQIKRVATDDDKKIYEVIEEALQLYLHNRAQSN